MGPSYLREKNEEARQKRELAERADKRNLDDDILALKNKSEKNFITKVGKPDEGERGGIGGGGVEEFRREWWRRKKLRLER